MAFRITSPANANIASELATTFNVTCTGFTYYGSTSDLLVVRLIINDVQVDARSITLENVPLSEGFPQTVSFNLNTIKSAIYTAATGKSLTGCVRIEAQNKYSTYTVDAPDVSSGTLTIAGRLTTLTNSTVNPYDLDNPTNIVTGWTRPHTAFYGRITVYVNGVYCWSRYGFGTSTNFNPNNYSGYITNMINAMGGLSPRELKIVIQSQFLADNYIDLSGGLLTSTRATGVEKDFVTVSDLTQNPFTIGNAITFAIAEHTAGVTYELKYEIGGVTVINRTTGITAASTSITPTPAEITAMYNATGNTTTDTTTVVATLTTIWSGSAAGTSVKNATLTIGTGAGTYPTFTTITNSENNAIVTAAAIGAYVQALSKLNLAFSGAAAGLGATITAYKITVQNQAAINAASGVSTTLNDAGTVAIVGRITDSRNRYYEATVNITVLAYEAPKIINYKFERSNGTIPDPLGTYGMYTFEVQISQLLNGTQKNTIQYRISKKTGSDPYTLQYQSVASGSVTSYNLVQHYSGYSELSAWDAKLEVIDKFYTTMAEASISTGQVVQSWDEEGVGFGKIKNEDATVDIGANPSGNSLSADGRVTMKDIVNHEAGSAVRQTNMGSLYTASATNVGTIIIDLGSQNLMLSAKITIRSYNFLAEIKVGGYTYTSTAAWFGPQALGKITGSGGTSLNVRFSAVAIGGKRYIMIGETGTDWGGYLHVTVDEVQVGYPGNKFTDPFTITIGTSYLGTVSATLAVTGAMAAADILTAIKTVDGVGSGLDADLLGGQAASYYSDIVGYGSAGTDHFIKFKDGTLIKYGTFTLTTAVATARGTNAYYTCADQSYTWRTDSGFPAFTTLPEINIRAYNTGTSGFFSWSTMNVEAVGSFKWNLCTVLSASSRAWTIIYRATGRWN